LVPSPKLAVDGIFDPLTFQAVLQYQKGVFIAADGVVGKQTWYHLLKGDKVTALQPSIAVPRPPVASPTTQSSIAPRPLKATPPPPPGSIWEWPLEEKLLAVLERVPSRLPGRARDEFKALLQFESLALSLAIIAGFCLVSGGTALVLGVLILGLDMTMSLASALQTAALAATEDELNDAADELAHIVLAVGVAAFIKGVGKIAKGVSGGGRGGAAEAPPKSIEGPQQPRSTSPIKPQPEEPQTKAPLKFGKRGIYKEPGAQPPTKQLREEVGAAEARRKLPPPEKAGWPEISSNQAATFNKPPEPKVLPAGTKLYRVIDSESDANGFYWTTTDPRTMSEAQWRSGQAVKGEWNGDGAFVEYKVPKGGMKVWSGEAAPQLSSDGVNVLRGGGNQIWIPAGSTKVDTIILTRWAK